MIWADRIAIALFALIAVIFGIIFVSSEAPLREAEFRAKAAKLATACPPNQVSPDRSAETSSADAPEAVRPEVAARASATPESAQRESGAQEPKAASPKASDPAATDTVRLPANVCGYERMKAEVEAETEAQAEAERAPTVVGTLIDIAEAGIFFVAPLWVGLRIVDIRTGGPRRRLARSPYWKATHNVRTARRRKRSESGL